MNRPLAITVTAVLATGCAATPETWFATPVTPNVERLVDGERFTPNTQSFGRGEHQLDMAKELVVTRVGDQTSFSLALPKSVFSIDQVPMQSLVPRLFYPIENPDEFDAFNLRMAEFSRNGVTFAHGQAGDTMPHFESSFDNTIPWSVQGPYKLAANPQVRPLRASVVNNCLEPGLWEMNASDRAGELYHAWFQFPLAEYQQAVARENGLPVPFVEGALGWSEERVAADLDRLRTVLKQRPPSTARINLDGKTGFSSQSSRRKLHRGFATVNDQGQARPAVLRRELVELPVEMVDFVPPGIYDPDKRKPFDLTFLATCETSIIRDVTPLTAYPGGRSKTAAIEIELQCIGGQSLVLGNLPVERLVHQDDYVIAGFGVGIAEASIPSERRLRKWVDSPSPSFAYLLQTVDGQPYAINSHARGLEQVYIRTFAGRSRPVFEITVTSFERIVDIARFEVDIPPDLVPDLVQVAGAYLTPVYLTLRDDNLR